MKGRIKYVVAFVSLACWLCCGGCVAPDGAHRCSSVDDALQDLLQAVERNDRVGFRDCLTTDTRAWIDKNVMEPDADQWIMVQLRDAMPLEEVGQVREDGRTKVRLQRTSGQVFEIVFVKQENGWKVDLRDDLEYWKHLGEWFREVEAKMKKATPLIGMHGTLPSHPQDADKAEHDH